MAKIGINTATGSLKKARMIVGIDLVLGSYYSSY
jgi:hypothetical protein